MFKMLASLIFSFLIVGISAESWTRASYIQPGNYKYISATLSGGGVIAASATFGAKGIFLSADGGRTYSTATNMYYAEDSNTSWVGVAASTNAHYALQEGGGLFILKSGWSRNKVDTSVLSPHWSQVACDSTGQYVALTHNNVGIYYSKDYAKTFTVVKYESGYSWSALAVSYYGYQIMAVRETEQNALVLYNSVDSGETWKAIGSSQKYTSVHYPQSYATYVYASVAPNDNNAKGGIYVSNNGGSSWTLSTGTDEGVEWKSVVSDASGRYVTAAVAGGNVYISSDFGVTFTQSTIAPTLKNWTDLSVSGDGTRIFATTGGDDGVVYYTWNGKA